MGVSVVDEKDLWRAVGLKSDRPESRDDVGYETAKRERRIEQLIDRLSQSWRPSARWLRRPTRRVLRVSIGVLLIVGSFLSILPVLGLWMLPLGAVLLAEDVPVLCQATDRVLMLRTIQMIQQTPPSRFPVGLQPTDLIRGESRDPFPPWAPAFAGEAGLSEMLGCLMNRVNDSEH